jgi:peptide/nickel transport system permease protein
MRRFKHPGQTAAGIILLALCVLTALLAPQISPPADPDAPEAFKVVGRRTDQTPHPPDENAPWGTLPGQLDVFHLVVWGMRSAFQFGLLVVLLSGSFGVLYGAISAYLGGRANQVLMRVTDAFLAFPIIGAVVFLAQIFTLPGQNPGSNLNLAPWLIESRITPFQRFLAELDPLLIGLILFSWMSYARLVQANMLHLKYQEYVVAARALGANGVWILLRHLLPNSLTPAIALAARDIGGMVVLQATFTFIGLGASSPWGVSLNLGRNWVLGVAGNPFTYWWVFLPVTFALVLFGLSWTLVGDMLNDWADPRQR